MFAMFVTNKTNCRYKLLLCLLGSCEAKGGKRGRGEKCLRAWCVIKLPLSPLHYFNNFHIIYLRNEGWWWCWHGAGFTDNRSSWVLIELSRRPQIQLEVIQWQFRRLAARYCDCASQVNSENVPLAWWLQLILKCGYNDVIGKIYCFTNLTEGSVCFYDLY